MSIDLYDIAHGLPPRVEENTRYAQKFSPAVNTRDVMQPLPFHAANLEVYNNTSMWLFISTRTQFVAGITLTQLYSIAEYVVAPYSLVSVGVSADLIGLYFVQNRTDLSVSSSAVLAGICTVAVYSYPRPSGTWEIPAPDNTSYGQGTTTVPANSSASLSTVLIHPPKTNGLLFMNLGSVDLDVAVSGNGSFAAGNTPASGYSDYQSEYITIPTKGNLSLPLTLDPGWTATARNTNATTAGLIQLVPYGYR
jgi:hypothetical protein